MLASEVVPASSTTLALVLGSEKPRSLLSSSWGDASSWRTSWFGVGSKVRAEYEKVSSNVVAKLSKSYGVGKGRGGRAPASLHWFGGHISGALAAWDKGDRDAVTYSSASLKWISGSKWSMDKEWPLVCVMVMVSVD